MILKNFPILAVIVFLYCLNIQFKIPETSISLPAYDFFIALAVLLYLCGTSLRIKISSCLRPYITKVSIALLVIMFLSIASIINAVFIYNYEFSLRDINSLLIYPRLIFYIVVGAVLAFNHMKYDHSFLRLSRLIIILSMSYLVFIVTLQFAEYQGVHIPLLGQFALSYLPEKYPGIRLVGTAGNPNWSSFDLNIICSAVFSYLIIAVGNRKTFRLIIMVVIIATLFLLIVATLSRTGIISYFLLFLLFMAFITKKAILSSLKSKIFYGFAATLVLALVISAGDAAYNRYKNRINQRIDATMRVEQFGQRATMWEYRLETGMDRLPLGIGPSRSDLQGTVDNEFISTLGNAGIFGLITYGLFMLFLIYKPLSLIWQRLPSEIYAILFFAVALGVLSVCYSLTADLARNLRPSSLIFMLHSFFCCRVILLLKNRKMSQRNANSLNGIE